ncbi:MAG: DHHA1 domain-containing protein [Candidatus Nanopusillus sp.]
MDFSDIAREIKDSNEEILIVADSDLDGKMSLGLMKVILEKLNKKYIEYFRIIGENNLDLIRILDGIIFNKKTINTMIFLDTPMDDKYLINFSKRHEKIKIIYIDHHKRKIPKFLPNNLVYFDVRALFNLEICTTSIVYRIGKTLFGEEFSKYSLLASIGAIGDFMLENDNELLDDLLKNYNGFYNGKYFYVPYIIYFYLFLISDPYKISKNIDKALNIEEFIKDFDLKKLKNLAIKYYDRLKSAKKIYESEKLLVFKAKKSSVISTILSSFYPEKIILVLSLKEKLFERLFKGKYRRYSISLRNQSGKYDLGILMREFTKEYGITGGGHPKAAGGLVYEKDIENLIRFLEEKTNEKN